jgi:Phosphotransferase enzyme family
MSARGRRSDSHARVSPVEAACEAAREFGVRVTEPVVLSDTNNVVVWLAPSAVVAKIGTGHHRRLADELRIVEYLVIADAPVVGPADELPRRVHHHHGFEMTFWAYTPTQDEDVRPRSLAQSLHRLHDALGKMPTNMRVTLPSVVDELVSAQRLLDDRAAVPLLGSSDRKLLTAVLASGAAMAPKQHVLHGSPHDRNILVVNGLPLFIDFETTCVGPFEWDLAHLDDEVAEHYPDGLDFGMLARCRTPVSAKTAVWCWDKAANSSKMSWHAEHHLNIVKQSLA